MEEKLKQSYPNKLVPMIVNNSLDEVIPIVKGKN